MPIKLTGNAVTFGTFHKIGRDVKRGKRAFWCQGKDRWGPFSICKTSTGKRRRKSGSKKWSSHRSKIR